MGARIRLTDLPGRALPARHPRRRAGQSTHSPPASHRVRACDARSFAASCRPGASILAAVRGDQKPLYFFFVFAFAIFVLPSTVTFFSSSASGSLLRQRAKLFGSSEPTAESDMLLHLHAYTHGESARVLCSKTLRKDALFVAMHARGLPPPAAIRLTFGNGRLFANRRLPVASGVAYLIDQGSRRDL